MMVIANRGKSTTTKMTAKNFLNTDGGFEENRILMESLNNTTMNLDSTESKSALWDSKKSNFGLLDSTNLLRPKLELGDGFLKSGIDEERAKFSTISMGLGSTDLESRLLTSMIDDSNLTTNGRNGSTTKKRIDLTSTWGVRTANSLLYDSSAINSMAISTSLNLENSLLGSGQITNRNGNLIDVENMQMTEDDNEKNQQGETDELVGQEIVFEDFDEFRIATRKDDYEIHDSSLIAGHVVLDRRNSKLEFVNALSGALISTPNFTSKSDGTRRFIMEKAEVVAAMEPEFVLKVAIYTRRELNMRTPSNFLLALAAYNPSCRQYLRQYFNYAIILPTDWIEVAELYRSIEDEDSEKTGKIRLPSALRRVMVERFSEFDAYQLAKHNKGKKTNKKTGKERLMKDKKRRGKWQAEPSTKEDAENKETDREQPKGKLNLKKLIRALHVQKPAFHVMALIGKRYPADSITFHRSGLLGVFDESKAGKRMKIPIPETWETRLAREGNKPEVWQQLLDKRKLPFMAMLRNLRNMIRVGIGPDYHTMVLKRLQNQNQVAQSKQFPFRFFSAYQALDDLEKEYEKKVIEIATAQQQPVSVKTGPIGMKKRKKWWVEKRKQENMRQDIHYDVSLLNRYRKALDAAVKIATTHNVSPIRGRTIVFCKADESMDSICTGAKGLGKPKTTLEIGALLSLLCKFVCEDCVFMIFTDNAIREISVAKGTILTNVEVVLNQATTLREEVQSTDVLVQTLRQFTLDRTKINNLLLVTNSPRGSADDTIFVSELKRYRDLVLPDILYVNINLAPPRDWDRGEKAMDDPRNVYLRGYSDQILRFIAVRGGDAQLARIDHMDEIYKLKKPERTIERPKAYRSWDFGSSETRAPSKSSTIKIFVSSTFRDMHGERVVLSRYVFPELQRRAARLGLSIMPIDLRWGISESDVHSMRSLELCLREVSKCQFFIGLLGERYGWRPPTYNIGDDASEELSWLATHPRGCSITELEMEQFALRDPVKASGKCFFYFRDTVSGVPESFRNAMCAEDGEAARRVAALKKRINAAGHLVFESYPCRWSGVHEGFPSVSNLEMMAQRVVDDLWRAMSSQYGQEDNTTPDDESSSLISTQWYFIGEIGKKFVGRHGLLETILTNAQKLTGGIITLDSVASSGLTSIMAEVATIARDNQQKYGTPIVWFSDALRGQSNAIDSIRYLYEYLAMIDGKERQTLSASASVTKEMWSEIINALVCDGYRLVFILDGLPSHQLEWIVEATQFKAVFIVPSRDNASLISTWEKSGMKMARISIGGLDRSDSASMVRKILAGFGKRMDESAFNSQMRTLLSKRDADKPSYLIAACEYLRLYAVSEKLAPLLLRLPSTMDALTKMVVTHAEKDHGSELVTTLLAFVVYNDGELSTDDLYQLCAMAMDSKISRKTQPFNRRLAYSSFLFAFNALRIILREQEVERRKTWTIGSSSIATIVKVQAKRNGFDQKKFTKLAAEYYWNACDPNGDMQFAGLSRHNCVGFLKNLIELGEWERVCEALSSLNLIKKSFELGFVSSLMVYRNPVAKNLEQLKTLSEWDRVLFSDVSKFLSRNCEFLTRYPRLVDQQFLNEPQASAVGILASNHAENQNHSIVRWGNKPEIHSYCDRSIKFDDGTAVRSVAISPNGRLAAIAVECVAKVFDFESGQEIHGFVGHQDVINDVRFLSDSILCTCADDGLVIIWDTDATVRLRTLEGHVGHVSMCIPFFVNRAFGLITVGWDSSIRLWNRSNGKAYEVITTNPASPINCVDKHPIESIVVTGHWNGTLMIYCIGPSSRKAILRGHKCAVRSVAYYDNGMFIASASFDGEVRLWSAEYGTTVGSFVGHLAPVNRIILTKDYLMSAADDCAIKLWAPTLGRMRGLVSSGEMERRTSGAASSCALTPDGSFVAIGYSNHDVTLYCLADKNRIVWTRTMSSSVQRIRFVPFPKAVMVACRSSVQILNFETGEIVETFVSSHGNVECAECSSTVAIVAHTDGALCFYSLLLGGKQKSRDPCAVVFTSEGSITDCTLNNDATLLATVATDKSLSIWKIGDILCKKTKLPMKTFSHCHGEWISSCSWSNTKAIIATASTDCTVKLWDVRGNREEPLVTLNGHSAPVIGVKMRRGCIVTASLDGTVAVWSHKGVLVTQLQVPARERPTSLDFLLDLSEFGNAEEERSWAELMEEEESGVAGGSEGTFDLERMQNSIIAVCYDNGNCRLWNPFLGDERISLINHSERVFALDTTVSGSDLRFVSGGADGCFNTWTIGLEQVQNRETKPVHRGSVTCISTSPNARLIASGGTDGHLSSSKQLDGVEYSPPFVWDAHEKAISGLVWLDDSLLISGSEDGMLKMWMVDWDEKVDGSRSFVELPFGQPIVAIASDSSEDNMLLVALWNGEMAKVRFEKESKSFAVESTVMSCATIRSIGSFGFVTFAASSDRAEDIVSLEQSGLVVFPATSMLGQIDSTSVIRGTDGGEVIASLINNGEEEFRIKAHTLAVTGVCEIWIQDSDGIHFATASKDSFVRLWRKAESVKLIGLWQGPAPLTCMTSSNGGKLWCGDALGRIHELNIL